MATKRISEFLDGSDIRYVTISHSPAYGARRRPRRRIFPGDSWRKP